MKGARAADRGMSPRPNLTISRAQRSRAHAGARYFLRRKREVDVFFRGGAAGSDPVIAG